MKLISELGKRKHTDNSKRLVKFGLYECPSCGNRVEVSIESVKSGNTTKCYDCGHKKRKGLSTHRLYDIWRQMRYRTMNPKNREYINYGGRGIYICDAWREDYLAFYNWAINNGYDDTLTIDRINNNGNYEPSNCRWTTYTIQNTNQRIRSDNKSGYAGVRFESNTKKWLAYIRVNRKAIRIKLCEDKQRAVEARNYYIIANNLPHIIQEYKEV